MSGPQLATASTRNRVEKCRVHAHGQFAIDTCPWCKANRVPTEKCHLARVELARRVALDAAIMQVIEYNTPRDHFELAALVTAATGVSCGMKNAAAALCRLRGQGRTTLDLKTRERPDK